jgi:hypothetical protein
MKSPQVRGVETRRLYCFEGSTRALSDYANKQRRLAPLRRLAAAVWADHGRKGLPPPVIEFGTGTLFSGQSTSYCAGYSLICLVEGQRDIGTLLHELTHALGYGTPHGPGFVRKYFDLLVSYGRCERGALELDAALFKLKA